MADTSLLSGKDMIVLYPASESKDRSDAAEYLQEIQSIAYAINSAANTGKHKISWNHEISEAAKSMLVSKNYVITQISESVYPERTYEIKWG